MASHASRRPGDWTKGAHLPGWQGRGARVALALGSYRVSVFCLVGLLLLTWLGTLHQVDHGLHGAQQAYFESFVVVQRPAGLWVGSPAPEWIEAMPIGVPLPGGMTLMLLLGINLIVGGGGRLVLSMVRSKVQRIRRLGVLVTHVGIAVLLLAGLVKQQTAIEGGVSLFEGQIATAYHSFHDWELVACRQVADGEVEEHRIPGKRFLGIGSADRARSFASPHLPFRLEVEQGYPNANWVPSSAGPTLAGRKRFTEEARNLAGVRLAAVGADGVRHTALLHGRHRPVWTVPQMGDGRDLWVLELRKATYPLPFPIQLDDFEIEWHPGTRKPKAFRSHLTVWDESTGSEGRGFVLRMNQPLRAGDTVVYQSSWGPEGAMPGEALFSGLQVVHNPTDSWPLIGCVIVTLGMLLAFGSRLFRHLWKSGTHVAKAAAAVLLGMLLLADSPRAQDAGSSASPTHNAPASPSRVAPWPQAAVDAFAMLPVQHDGRVKPLLSRVGYLLLRCNGKRSVQIPEDLSFGDLKGKKLGPVAWALDVCFFPELADRYPMFLVRSQDVVEAIDVTVPGKKRSDRYSATELKPGIQKLMTLAERYERVPAQERTGLQEQLVGLARNVADYERLIRSLDGARVRLRVGSGLPEVGRSARLSQVISNWAQLQALASSDPDAARALRGARQLAQPIPLLRWLPTAGGETGAADGVSSWLGSTEAWRLSRDGSHSEAIVDVLRLQEEMLDSRRDPERFADLAKEHLAAVMEVAGTRAEHVTREVAYLRADPFYRALLLFGAALLPMLGMWLMPRRKAFSILAAALSAGGLGILIHGIVVRCLLRDRPPITGLYDTILFVTAAVVAGCLLLEWLQRRRVYLSLGVILGVVGMLLEGRYEAIDGRDTMPTLMAVLDTNFWLATHVIVITLGYASSLLAGGIAHVILLGRALGMHRTRASAFREMARATYGVVCFAALTTTVGTILGGIWANDSWGRFWGWDPKENGALMIVLWNLVILHARLGGMVRDLGLATMAVFGNIIVVFSWFHTNLLGVGLHSYGFSGGLHTMVWSSYWVESAFVALGLAVVVRERWMGGTPRSKDGAHGIAAPDSGASDAISGAVGEPQPVES